MSKRRLSLTESNDDSQKKLNLGNRVDKVDTAIGMLIEDYTQERFTDDDAIVQSTHALARLRHGSSPLYIMRAKALARKSKFKEAIQDAMTAIDYQPDAAEGYLAAAHVYSMQGKEKASMSIIDAGLQRAVETTQLSERKTRIRDVLDRKIDFVARLPTEVTAAIIESLYCEFDRTLVYCSLVSKYWRDVILNHCASLWRYVILDGRLIQFNPVAILLPVISKHVYSLALRRITSDNALMEKIVDMAATDKFPLVSSISIVTSTLLLLEYHISLITLFRKNLTKISITIIEFDMGMSDDEEDDSETTTFSLNVVLSLCPNLQELVFSSRQNITYYPLQPSSPNGYKLLKLALNIQQAEHLLERLIPNCPNLQILNVDHLTPSIINLAYHRLPQLRYLKTFDYCHVDLSTLSFDNNQYGLYDLDCDIVGADQLQNMMLLLVASKATMKNLNLFIRHPELIDGISQVAMLSFDVLTTLELFIMGHDQSFSNNIATALIHQCPMLESVTLTLGDTQVSESFYDCLAMKLQLRFIDVSKVNSPSSGLEQFFDTLGTRGDTCALQGVVLGGQAVTDHVVYSLAKVTTLKAITLRNCTMLSAAGVEAFVSRLRTLISLTEITLEAIPYLNDDMVLNLTEVMGLQFIELGHLDQITSFGIRYLADHARHLRRLAVFSCPNVDRDSLQYIARRVSYYR